MDDRGILRELVGGEEVLDKGREDVIEVWGEERGGSGGGGDEFFVIEGLGNLVEGYGCEVMVRVGMVVKGGEVIKGRWGDLVSGGVEGGDRGIWWGVGVVVKLEGMGGVGEMLEMGDVYYVGVVGEGEE